MRNWLTIDDKIGFLNPQSGRYIWAKIIAMNTEPDKPLIFTLKGILDRQNIFDMPYEEIKKLSKVPSVIYKDKNIVKLKY